MAAATRRLSLLGLLIALNLWAWGLFVFVMNMRFYSVERPPLPFYEAFPYGEIRIGVDASFPPFAVAGVDGLIGLDVDLGRALAKDIGLPVRFINMGFDGLYDSIRADKVDAVISALLVDPMRLSQVRYTAPYFDNGLVLVTASDSNISNVRDIVGQRLAFEFGSPADNEARRWLRRVEAFETRPYELPTYALDSVRLSDADAALVDAVTYRLYMQDHGEWQTRFTYITHAPYAIAVRVDRSGAWQNLNRALNNLRQSGELQRIIERWL